MILSLKKAICIAICVIMCLTCFGCSVNDDITDTAKNIGEDIPESTSSKVEDISEDCAESDSQNESIPDNNSTIVGNISTDSVMAPYEKIIREAAQKYENAKYFIHDSNGDGFPELIINDEYGMSHYIYNSGKVHLTASYSCSDFAIYTYPEKKGFILMEESEDSPENTRKYIASQISADGQAIEIGPIFEYSYPLRTDEYYYADAEGLFGSLPVFNPKTKISGSRKLGSFSIKDLSGVKYYNKNYGNDINELENDILSLGYFKNHAFFDMNADGNPELVLSAENAWNKYCFALKDGKLLNLGCIDGKYGIGENENKRLTGRTGGTGMAYHAEYYMEDDALYLNPDWNLLFNSDQNGSVFFYKNEKITEDEFKSYERNIKKLFY